MGQWQQRGTCYKHPVPQAECAVLTHSGAGTPGLPSPYTETGSKAAAGPRAGHQTHWFPPSSVTSPLSGLEPITSLFELPFPQLQSGVRNSKPTVDGLEG